MPSRKVRPIWNRVRASALCLSASVVWAQAPPTIEQALESHHIGTSRGALIAALRNSDPDVRGLAAMELASFHDKSAIEAIRGAVNVERSTLERSNMARALKLLGDPLGMELFRQICSDVTIRPDLRLEAADELAPTPGGECVSSVLGILASSDNSVITDASLGSLLKFDKEVVSGQPASDALARGLVSALSSTVADVRQKAAECISSYKVTAAASALEAATKSETDPVTRAALVRALNHLRS